MPSKANTHPSPITRTFGERKREKRNVISFTFGLKLGFADLVLVPFGA